MKASLLVSAFFFSALSFSMMSCVDTPDEDPPNKVVKTAKPQVVGRVATTPAGKSFVLIQSYGTWNVTNGSILTTQGPEGRSANLRVTGEKLGQYAAADVQSGTLEVGDGVYTVIIPAKTDIPPVSPSSPEEKRVIPNEPVVGPEDINQPIIPLSPSPEASES